VTRTLAFIAGAGLAVVGIAVYLYASSEYTACYGVFESQQAAEEAAEVARESGFDAEVEQPSSKQVDVTFESGETGGDAGEFRATFHKVVAQAGGEHGHPGTGCVERTPIGK
jgi:hypothetical protein